MARPARHRRARGRAAISVAVALGVLAACSHGSSDASAPSTTAAPTTTTTIPRPTVDSTGAAPRVRLRYALHEGDEQTVAITSDASVAQELSSGDRLVD